MPLDKYVRGVGTHTMAEKGPELYPTPEPVTRALIDNHTLGRTVLEPAAGLGHMVKVLEEDHDVTASDLHDYGAPLCRTSIRTGVDFLQDYPSQTAVRRVPRPDPMWSYDSLVTNPPFSLAADFVRTGLQVAPEVVILARLQFIEGQRRADIFRSLRKVLVFENRLPMMHRWVEVDGTYQEWGGKKAASAMCFAFFVFDVTWDGTTHGAQLKRIRWQQPGK